MSTAPPHTSKPEPGQPLGPVNVTHGFPGLPHPLGPEALDVELPGDSGVDWDTGMHTRPPPSPNQKKGVNKSQAGKEGPLLTHSANSRKMRVPEMRRKCNLGFDIMKVSLL